MRRRVSRAWWAVRAYLFGVKPRVTAADVRLAVTRPQSTFYVSSRN